MSSRNLKQFKLWTIEIIASGIVVSSYYDELTTSIADMSQRDYWICITGGVSVLLSMLGFLACVIQQERNGGKLESLLVWLLAALWSVSTTVAILGPFGSGAEQTLSSSHRFISFHPNVYFFSLWSFTVSMLLVASWCKEFLFGGRKESDTTQWVLLQAFSLFTMLSALSFRDYTVFAEFSDPESSNITKEDLIAMADALSMGNLPLPESLAAKSATLANWTAGIAAEIAAGNENATISDETEDDTIAVVFEALIEDGTLEQHMPCDKDGYSCARIRLAIGLSAATALVGLIMTPLKGADQACQMDISIVLSLLWLPSLVLLTVSPGPATRAGNLYFGIYICYFLVLSILVSSTTRIPRDKQNGEGTASPDNEESESTDTAKPASFWEAAYGKLEKNSYAKPRIRTHSDDSLFDEVEEWDELTLERMFRSGFEHDSDPRSTRLMRWGSIILFQGSNGTGASGRHAAQRQPSQESQAANMNPEEWSRRVSRLKLWCILLTMGIVLVCTFSNYDNPRTGYIVSSISIGASFVGIATSLRVSMIAGVLQIVSICTAFCTWVTGVVLFLQSSGHVFGFSTSKEKINMLLGERNERPVEDPNVFFGVWISMIAAILLVTNRCKASLATNDWIFVATASVALLISSTNYLKGESADVSETIHQTCDTDFSISCKKQTFARYLATATLCVSVPMTLLSQKLGPIWHVLLSVPLVVTWGFGVLYVTFSNYGATPAATFFSFWGGICLTLELATVNTMTMFRQREKAKEDENNDDGEHEASLEMSPEANKASLVSSKQLTEIIDESLPPLDLSKKSSFKDEYSQNNPVEIEASNVDGKQFEDGFGTHGLGNNCDGDERMATGLRGYSNPNTKPVSDMNQSTDDKLLEAGCNEHSQSVIEGSVKSSRYGADTIDTEDFKECIEYDSYQHPDDVVAIDTESGFPSQAVLEASLNRGRRRDDSSTDTSDFIDCSDVFPKRDII